MEVAGNSFDIHKQSKMIIIIYVLQTKMAQAALNPFRVDDEDNERGKKAETKVELNGKWDAFENEIEVEYIDEENETTVNETVVEVHSNIEVNNEETKINC